MPEDLDVSNNFDGGTPTVSSDIAQRLRAMIHSGELGPGDRLPPERELATQLRVGRVSIREALRLLQARGYVEVRRGATGGAFITQLDEPYQAWLQQTRAGLHDIDDILDLRIGLEGRAATLAAHRRTQQDLDRMATAIADLTNADSRMTFRSCDARFHAALARASGSPRLESAIAVARGEMFAPVDKIVFTEIVEATRVGHESIYLAVRDGDAALAAKAVENHLERTRQEVAALIATDAPNASPRDKRDGR